MSPLLPHYDALADLRNMKGNMNMKMKNNISHFLMIRTLSLMAGMLMGMPALADNVTLTSSNLPIVIIETEAAINADAKVKGTMKIIANDEGRENSVTDAPLAYDGPVGIKWRGESSLSFNQKKYTIETWDAEGNDSTVSLLGMPAEADWVLLAPYNDVSMVRDVFAYYMWNEMGHWGPRTRMCEVVVNGEYMGVYALCESIKRDKNRVDVSKLKPEDLTGRDLTGGYILRIDAVDKDDVTFTSKVKGIQTQQWGWGWGGGGTTQANITWTVFYPKKADLQVAQKDYIQSYVDTVELAIQAANFSDPEEGYAKYIDTGSFVDYFIHTELSLNADGFKRSAYFYKEKDKKDGTRGKLFAGPVWDFNLAYGNCNFCNASKVTAWVHEGCETNPTPVMWKRLLEDENFRNAVRTRYQALRQTILSEESIDAFLDSYATLLAQAKDRQLRKYKEVLKSANGGWDMSPTSFYAAYRVSTYAEEIATVKSWFRKRLAFLDEHLPGQVVSSAMAPDFYDVDVRLRGRSLKVSSSRPLARVDVVDALGTLLHTQPMAGTSEGSVSLRGIGGGFRILVCYAEDGSMVSHGMMVK